MRSVSEIPSSIRGLREQYRTHQASPRKVVELALKRANSNASHNVYLARDDDWTRNELEQLLAQDPGDSEAFEKQPLWGVPVSLKDCFDLEGYITTCGSRFLGASRTPASADSSVASRLKRAGAIITGKTHLHQLAYGITGENRDFGNCLQPAHARLLTGGSSSGAAASVQEGSAMAAIGTDTGGSIRVPAALCGLAGYRCSITLSTANEFEIWRGGDHLALSFDTIGWLYRDLGDGPLLGAALFGLLHAKAPDPQGLRIGMPNASFLHDCEEEVLAALEHWASLLRSRGAQVVPFDAGIWREAMDLYAPLQANEAAALHPEPRDGFEPVIAERLRWGGSLSASELAEFRRRLTSFCQTSEQKLKDIDFVLLPCSPTAELRADENQSATRLQILRYTTPVSLLGWPAVTLPGRRGGPQLVGKLDADAELLALSAALPH
ncbi:amidase [Alloacidobacterium dinghuense]|uniref:Amidase n=1 Tax=Alloacidobacterium dinghuense TaxID=2763107 RepID=A0A7G8BM07_9BACT|nr:amidase [Alloacidobacterium dinghuense]QNI33577.1 amidase [Alloacidobacterium dinghuense]